MDGHLRFLEQRVCFTFLPSSRLSILSNSGSASGESNCVGNRISAIQDVRSLVGLLFPESSCASSPVRQWRHDKLMRYPLNDGLIRPCIRQRRDFGHRWGCVLLPQGEGGSMAGKERVLGH
jgi:hypothetical protein